jgi:hypothetical protein
MLAVSDMAMVFLLPALIAVALIALVLRPGVKLLYFSKRGGTFSHYVLLFICLVFPTVVVQQYLQTATGKLTVLETINQYESQPKTKYYQVKHYHVAPSLAGQHQKEYTSGKHQTRLHWEAYFAQPIYGKAQDTLSHRDHYWLCTYYHRSISTSEPTSERILDRARFNQYIETDYPATPFYTATYWERMGIVDKTNAFETAVSNSPVVSNGPDILFIPHYDAFANRSGNNGLWSLAAILGGILLYYLILALTRLKTPEELEND